MNTKEWAKLLDGRERRREVAFTERMQAKQDGIVIVFGYSDDNMVFEGVIVDEIGCYKGGTAYINPETKRLFVSECEDDDCPYAGREMEKCIPIRAIWCAPDSPAWTFKTDIPHETFNVMEDGEVFCRGIVFSLDDLVKVAG